MLVIEIRMKTNAAHIKIDKMINTSRNVPLKFMDWEYFIGEVIASITLNFKRQ